jgi:uncharacterized protein YlzI (FlbEa/FlbD family)
MLIKLTLKDGRIILVDTTSICFTEDIECTVVETSLGDSFMVKECIDDICKELKHAKVKEV